MSTRLPTIGTISLNQDEERFFDELVTMLCALSSVGSSLHGYMLGQPKRWEDGEFMTLGGTTVTNRTLAYLPREDLHLLAHGTWPDTIELHELELSASPGPQKPIHRTGLQVIWGSIAEWAFLHYFEAQAEAVQTKFGSKELWPDVWQFGRCLRNAFAHGGSLDIRNPMAPPVSWRGVTYLPKDSGRRVLFNDLGLAELVYLLVDMDAAL